MARRGVSVAVLAVMGAAAGVGAFVMAGAEATGLGDDTAVPAYAGVAEGNRTGAGGVIIGAAAAEAVAMAGVCGRWGVGRRPPPTAPSDPGVTDTGNVPPAIEITPPHTEQRARTPVAGTFAGSTRKTERQSGHETVMIPALHCEDRDDRAGLRRSARSPA